MREYSVNIIAVDKKSYDNGFSNVSLSFEYGKIYFLFGQSGSGKSCLLNMILGEEKPDKGEIYVFGKNVHAISKRKLALLRQDVSYIWQDIKLIEHKTVFENIAIPLIIKNVPQFVIKEKVDEVLNDTELFLYKDKYPSELPQGVCQKIGVMRALIKKPMLLIADEPMTFGDAQTELEIWELINKYITQKTTVIFSTSQKYLIEKFNGTLINLDNSVLSEVVTQ
ncbi:cell division ATP-binding protein FtsE [bacterium]